MIALILLGCRTTEEPLTAEKLTAGAADLSAEQLAQADELAALRASIQALRVDEHAADVGTLTAALDDKTGGVDLTQLDGDVARHAGSIADLELRVDAIDAGSRTTWTAQGERLAALETEALTSDALVDHESRIAAIEAGYGTDLASLDARVTTIEGSYATSGDFVTRVAANAAGTASLDDRVDLVEADVALGSDHADRIDDIEADVLVAADLEDHEDRIAAIEGGYLVAADFTRLENLSDRNLDDLDDAESRILAIEYDYTTSLDWQDHEDRIAAIEADYSLVAARDDVDGRTAAIEADHLLAADLDDHGDRLADLEADVGVPSAVTVDLDALEADHLVAADLDDHEARIVALEDDLFTSDTTWLENVDDVLEVDGTDLVWSGVNVFIDNASGSSTTRVAAVGNLFVGYMEDDGVDTRNGSHTLVIGPDNGYRGTGSIVAGRAGENHTADAILACDDHDLVTGTGLKAGLSVDRGSSSGVPVASSTPDSHSGLSLAASGPTSSGHAVTISTSSGDAESNGASIGSHTYGWGKGANSATLGGYDPIAYGEGALVVGGYEVWTSTDFTATLGN